MFVIACSCTWTNFAVSLKWYTVVPLSTGAWHEDYNMKFSLLDVSHDTH